MADSDLEKLVIELYQFMRGRYFGKFRGIVQESDKNGRIKAFVPEVYGNEVSPWAMPSVPYAGNKHGIIAIPKKDDGIWIEFEAGDKSRPIWSGCWWADSEKPEGKETMTLLTPGGHKIVLDDENNEIKIIHSSGPEIAMTNSDITLKISSKKIVISASGIDINDGTFKVM